MQAHQLTPEKPFAAPAEVFESIVGYLHSDEALTLSHGAVEAQLQSRGMELLRSLFQAHLDLRALAEPTSEVVGADDGYPRDHRLRSGRGLMTRFGPVRVRRIAYGGRGQSLLHPLDADLNLPPDRYSHGLRRVVGEEAAKSAFEDVTAAVENYTGGSVPKRQVEQLAAKSAVDFDAFYETRRRAPQEESVDAEIIVLTVDGKGVPMRPEHLREETRKAREKSAPKMKHRASKGEKRSTKRMATVASVYDINAFERTPEEVLRDFGPVREVEEELIRPKPQDKRVWADIERKPEAVIGEAFKEALHRDPNKQRTWVGLVDGNEHQIKVIKKLARKYGVAVTLILDFVHVTEYVWKAAFAFHPEGSKEAEEWVSTYLYDILNGRCSYVAAGMRRSATKRGLSKQRRAPVDKCADYLLKYRKMLRYDIFLEDGLPIATGVIEGACRYLVKDRMEITGARWSLEGAQAVLRLRALRASGDLEEYWVFHENRGYERNHRPKYVTVPHLEQPDPLDLRRRCHLRIIK